MNIITSNMPTSKKSAFNKAGLNSLLSVNSDAKTIKGSKKGYLTGVMYLAPHNTVTSNKVKTICPNAVNAGCYKGCLYTAGRGRFDNVKTGRIKRTESYLNNKDAFMVALWYDIKSLINKAYKNNQAPVIRLNGTSDISWHDIYFTAPNGVHDNIMGHYPDIQFYDYTKNTSLNTNKLPDNYYVVFSYSEANNKYANKAFTAALINNAGIAVVFRKEIPSQFNTLPVINGDESDLRFIDRTYYDLNSGPYVIGLKAKGEAKKDTSGFVI